MSQILSFSKGYINGWPDHSGTHYQPPLTKPQNSLIGGLRISKNIIVFIS